MMDETVAKALIDVDWNKVQTDPALGRGSARNPMDIKSVD
jgi:hypothetical protein